MNSTYSRSCSESESWSSPGDVGQVPDASSRRRILLSPQKVWSRRSQSKQEENDMRISYSHSRRHERIDKKKPCFQSRQHFVQANYTNKSRLLSRRAKASDRTDKSNSMSDSESDGRFASSNQASEGSVDSDTSFEAEVETIPVSWRVPRNPLVQNERSVSSAMTLQPGASSPEAQDKFGSMHPSSFYKKKNQRRTEPEQMDEADKDSTSRTTESGDDGINKKLGFDCPPPPFRGREAYTVRSPSLLQQSGYASIRGSSVRGSQALLSALKALQEEIVRLKEERQQLEQKVSDHKRIARKQEAERISCEKQFRYELDHTKEFARAAYDALRCDCEELKLQLVKSEERRKANQIELKHSQERVHALTMKADDLFAQRRISESHQSRLQTEIKELKNEHKRILSDLEATLVQTQQEKQCIAERRDLLEDQLQQESSKHAECKERLKQAEQAMTSISELNKQLEAKMIEATETANQTIQKNKELHQQVRASAVFRPTIASRANAAAVQAASKREASSTVSKRGINVSSVRMLKKTILPQTSTGTIEKPKKPMRF